MHELYIHPVDIVKHWFSINGDKTIEGCLGNGNGREITDISIEELYQMFKTRIYSEQGLI